MTHRATLIGCLLGATVGCSQQPSSQGSATGEPQPTTKAAVADAPKIPPTRYSVAALDLELDVFDNLQLLSYREDGDTVSLIQSRDPLRIAMWAGPDQSLATWRERLRSVSEVAFEPEQNATVCGRPAHRQEARVAPAQPAVGVVVGGDGAIGHLYQDPAAETHVAVAFDHKGRAIVLSWIVPTSQRDAYRADEDHLFASIVCR